MKENENIAGTITPHHMLLTKKDVYKENIDKVFYAASLKQKKHKQLAYTKG
mgnify:CR=1 FL=1